MQAIDLVRFALNASDHVFQALVADLRAHPLATQTPAGGNHALWTLGHLTYVEAALPAILSGEPHPLADWESLFNMGSKPTSDPQAYPTFDALLASYQKHRAITRGLVDQTGNEGLDRVPAHIPKGFENEMATFGQTFLMLALHQMLHAGELADIRRAVGFKPLA